jgi:hypothetical protein
MNIYKIKSDLISDEEYVVASDPCSAAAMYADHYSAKYYMSVDNITSIERICEDCLISQ